MASKVYDDKLLGQVLSEILTHFIESNPTVNSLNMEANINLLKNRVDALVPKNYNRYGKIQSMKDGLFLKLNVNDKSKFLDNDILIYFNGVITILQDGDVTRHHDIYSEIIIPKTFILQQGRKTPVVRCCTEDTYLLFKSFITRIVTYNGEYYIQLQFPHITDQIDEAQDIDIRVYVENEQLTLDLPDDPSAVAVESTCKSIPFGATPNHDPILNADKIVRSDVVRYLTISDTDHIIEDLKKTDPGHLIFRKENYPIDPTLPPDQQPKPDMASLIIKYNDSIIWTKDYPINATVSEGDIHLSPLEGFILDGIYTSPITNPGSEKITYPITMDQTKVYYAKYINRVSRHMMLFKNKNPNAVEISRTKSKDIVVECNTRDQFNQQLKDIMEEYNGNLRDITFIINFSDLSYLFKGMYFYSFPKIIVNFDFIDCIGICENTTIFISDEFKDFINQLQNLKNVIYKDSFKNLNLIDDPDYAGILKNPIRIVLKNNFNEIISTHLCNKNNILNLCTFIPHQIYEEAYLNSNFTQKISKPIQISEKYPSELVFYLKKYENEPIIIRTEEDLYNLQNKLLDENYDIENKILIFGLEFKYHFKLKTYKFPKSVYFMSNKFTIKPEHLIEWEILKGGTFKLDTYFDMIYDIDRLERFATCLDDETPAILDFSNVSVFNITELDNSFGRNVILSPSLSIFLNLKKISNLFRYVQPNRLHLKGYDVVDGVYYNLVDKTKEYVIYPKIGYNTAEYNSPTLYNININDDENISKFKLEDPINANIEGDILKIYDKIHPDTLNDPEFIWNKKKYKFIFKAYDFNFNVNGFLETEFEKSLSIHELIQIVHTKEFKLSEINNDVSFLDPSFSDDINAMLKHLTIICKKK